jgi:simple sugar transport system permease protein
MNAIFDIELLHAGLRLATPLLLAAMAGVLSERAGVVNIALEGMLLVGAFFGVVAADATHQPWLGVAGAAAAGVAAGALHGLLTLRGRVDHVISGLGINLLALGLTTFLLRAMFEAGASPSVRSLGAWHIPLLERVPILGAFLGRQSPLVYLAVLSVFAIHGLLYHTKFGLRVRALGESPLALEAAGVNPFRLRMLCLTTGGALAGIGGAFLSLESAQLFSENLSAGRGFIALAAVIFGKWTPLGAGAAALFFGAGEAIQLGLQGHQILGRPLPSQFLAMAPYVLTLIALLGFVGRATPPAALGRTEESAS